MKVENNLDTDKVRGLVWRLAFPSMLAQFVNVMYSIVDRMYIGNIPEIGALALAGVGICGPVVTLISSFASWIGVGGAPLMSIRLGQKNERAAAQMVANCFALLTGMALIMGMANSCGDLEAPVSKADTYKKVRELNDSFRKKNGSTICRELKGMDTGKVLRSCPGCIEDAAKILSEKLGE